MSARHSSINAKEQVITSIAGPGATIADIERRLAPVEESCSVAKADSIRGSVASIKHEDQGDQPGEENDGVQRELHVNFATAKFDLKPKPTVSSTRMKQLCCNIPKEDDGLNPYRTTSRQRPGLSPKSPVLTRGLFGPIYGHAKNLELYAKQTRDGA